MLGKITLYNGVVYKIGDRTRDTSDGLYSGRIMEELQLESRMSESGNAPITMNITIRNDDNFIPNTTDLWAAIIELTSNSGGKWTGKINFFDFDADGNLYITASEKAAPELELQLPDEVRQVYTVDEDFHPTATSMTIPLVIGGSSSSPLTLSTILIDKTEGVYLICVGEIRSILKVYNGSEELPASAYTAYTGTALQSEHPGFAYVKINEDYRKNSDGSYAEINVDVIGLVLGLYTAEECRNPARFLYYFLTTPATGVNGWGCGISASDIDQASFNTAITLCDTLGYKLDGIMWLRQSAQSWIDQICQTMHASYTIGANGKRTLFVDYAGAASKRTFTENDCKVSRYGKNSYTGSVYNKGVLSYGYNPITGLFMQSAQFEDATSVAQIGEQKFTGESYLINDAATALKVLEYTCKRSLTSAEAIEFETDRLETVLKAGDLITLDFPSRNISGDYQIASITASEYKSSISAVKFDTSVFTVTGSQSNVVWGDDRDITPALTPAQATNLLLSTGFDINPDGSGIPYISGTFDVPEGGWIAAAVQYGTGAVPANWTELALITEGRFKIQPVSVGTAYTIRIRMITATGHSSYITGQITSTGDTVAPDTPTLALSATEKNVIVKCALDNPPYDMGGFQVWRKRHTDEVFTLVGTVAANFGFASFADHVETFVQYDYKIKSYDRSGNLSDFSDVVSITPTGLEATELAATALKIPTGSILNINAKGSTTESIKTANGVIDGSGFGHHGQAFGGVSIIDGGEGFGFDGTANAYMTTTALTNSFSGVAGATFSTRASLTDLSASGILYSVDYNGSAAFVARITTNKTIQFGGKRASSETATTYKEFNFSSLALNKEYLFTFVYDFENAKIRLFIDGVLASEQNYLTAGTFMTEALSTFYFGRQGSDRWNGTIKDFRIYPRALSAVEVKSLFMIPQEVVLSRVTADVIGANAVNSIHINAGAVTANAVGSNEIITNVANISQAVVNNLNVSGNATFQTGLNGIQVGGRNHLRNSNFYLGDSNYWFSSSNILTVESDSTYGKVLKSVGTTQTSGTYQPPTGGIQTGQNVTFSAWAKASAPMTLYAGFNGNGISDCQPFSLTTSWQKISVTKSNTGFNLNARFYGIGTFYIANAKLEVGTRATDWTPAPEDVEADATTKANAVQSNLNAVTSNIYTPNTTTINGGKITTGSITAGAVAANAITSEKLSVTALNRPYGEVYNLATKGCTTASIQAAHGIIDSSGNMRHGNASGGCSVGESSKGGKNIVFNGDSYFFFPNPLGTSPSNFTIYVQFYLSSVSSTHTILQARTATGAGISLFVISNAFRFDFGSQFSNLAAATAGWHKIVITRTSSGIKFYLDKATSPVSVGAGSATSIASNFVSGCSFANTDSRSSRSNQMANGSVIHDITMWDRAISADEVDYIMRHSSLDTESGQITADRIATDAIKSRTLSGGGNAAFTTNGMLINLAGNGYISSPKFYIDSSGNAKFKGDISGATGTFGSVSITTGTLNGIDISKVRTLVEATETGSWATGDLWYRKYSDGWLEQGGVYFADDNPPYSVNITLLKPFTQKPKTYFAQSEVRSSTFVAIAMGQTGSSYPYVNLSGYNSSGSTARLVLCHWYVCGY